MNNPIHTYKLTIKEAHLDTFGHVNNATYLQILEEARWDWITANGYGLKKIQETKLGPVILDITISFKKELRLREEITIETTVLDYKSKISRIAQRILNSAGDPCCTATFTFGLFDTVNRKLVLPTQEWLKGLGL